MTGSERQVPARRGADRVVSLGAANITSIVVMTQTLSGTLGHVLPGPGSVSFLVLSVLRVALMVTGLVVSTSVTTTALAIVAAGQARDVAVRRLVGASAGDERRRIVRREVRRAVPASLLGAGAGYLFAGGALWWLGTVDGGPGLVAADLLAPLPAALGCLAFHVGCVRWAAARGCTPVTEGSPLAALRLATDPEHPEGPGGGPGVLRHRWAVRHLVWGAAVLGLAFVAAVATPLAVVPGLAGGVLALAGVIGTADRLVAGLVRLGRRLTRSSAEVDLAARTLLRHPERTGRAVLGVALGVAAVSMLMVGTATGAGAVDGYLAATAMSAGTGEAIAVATLGGVALVSLTAVVAALGVVATVAESIHVQRHEIALLRVLGHSRARVAAMIRAESALTAGSGVGLGLALGICFGWLGAHLLLAAAVGQVTVAPVVPWPLLPAAVACAVALTWASSAVPVRQTLSRSAIQAYLAS